MSDNGKKSSAPVKIKDGLIINLEGMVEKCFVTNGKQAIAMDGLSTKKVTASPRPPAPPSIPKKKD